VTDRGIRHSKECWSDGDAAQIHSEVGVDERIGMHQDPAGVALKISKRVIAYAKGDLKRLKLPA